MEWKKLAKKLNEFCDSKGKIPKALGELDLLKKDLKKHEISNLSELEKYIWQSSWETIQLHLKEDGDFEDYPSQQKWIAVQYILLQLLSPYNGYLKIALQEKRYVLDKGKYLRFVENSKSTLINALLSQGYKGMQSI